MSKMKNVVIDQQNNQNEKQQAIQYLTDLMATIQASYFKRGLFTPLEECSGSGICGDLWVHEGSDPNKSSVSIDLYHFGGDGKDVCEGLHGCTVTFDDGTTDTGWLFCMHYDPDDVTPLVFLFMPDPDRDDIDVEPDSVPLPVLQNITKWIESQFNPQNQ